MLNLEEVFDSSPEVDVDSDIVQIAIHRFTEFLRCDKEDLILRGKIEGSSFFLIGKVAGDHNYAVHEVRLSPSDAEWFARNSVLSST